MRKNLLAIVAIFLMLALVGCKENAAPVVKTQPETTQAVETMAPVETTETLPKETDAADGLLLDAENGKVCVGILPTEVGAWRYVVIPDQEAAVAAFEAAVQAKHSDEWWIKGDRTVGLMVVYNGQFWDFVESGELVCSVGRVKAENAAALYQLCAAAAREAGWKEGVKPEQLTDIRTAVLSQKDVKRTLTDPEDLAQLGAMLSGGKFSLGGTGCPFGALLTMELGTGETVSIRLATDSCGAWMSEGSYYDFGSDSQPLYDLFGVKLDFGEIVP